jgi:hypothetical protein
MEPVTSHPPTADAVVFRPSKKRKIYRQRGSSPSASPALDPSSNSPYAQTLDSLIAQPMVNEEQLKETEGTSPSITEVLRLQKARFKQRAGGVEFRAVPSSSRQESTEIDALNLHEDECIGGNGKEDVDTTGVGEVVRRFAKQTGMVGDVDKHM